MFFFRKRLSLFTRFKRKIIFYLTAGILGWGAYYFAWGRHLYTVTAYCDCPICVDVAKYRDHRFASGKSVYWGAVAADPKVPFKSRVELLPQWPQDWLAVLGVLQGRRRFVVEDRGGKIKGRHVDLFIPHSRGGHEMARQWGVRKMRIKVNGKLAD